MRSAFLLLALAAPVFAQLDPEKALAPMKPGEGLQVELFAAEPMLVNPTSMDIDPLGRVWITEAVNYRTKLHKKPLNRKEGDRIQVLIDEKGEGKATKAVTFYQGEELYGPLSVCVIPVAKGYRILVAQSPDILEFSCKDAANPVADGPPKKFLTGFGGFDHDHGVHGLHLGPDGKLYFTVGDQGVEGLQASDGKGRKFDSNKTDCQGGTVWRCDLDGKNLELIAHNFRNNYEACVDSFGEIWLSDNDDDGNQQTRICHVMPGGNYGYFPRGPGQSHWHEEQPGIVHKTLRTGFGSPTGIQFYEGSLLPKQYHNTILHCDAGPREVRAFTRKPKGAGYELDKALILTSSDTWFRPSDVCTAPDGSVFVCDWYDPGVGGHGMGDWTRGRVYRITPTGHKGYKMPETKQNFASWFANPCLSFRPLIQEHLMSIDRWSAIVTDHYQKEILETKSDALIARFALTCTGFIPTDSREWGEFPGLLQDSSKEQLLNTSWRIMASRINSDYLIENLKVPPKEVIQELPVSTRREFLLMLGRITAVRKYDKTILEFASFYDGQDIFYRAALNIACGTDPARRDAILADFDKQFPEWNDKVADLVWELRPKVMLPKLAAMLADPKFDAKYKPRIVDILAASDDPSAGKSMLGVLTGEYPPDVKSRVVENLKLFLPTKWNGLLKGGELKEASLKMLKVEGTIVAGLQLIAAAGAAGQVFEVDYVSDFATHKEQPEKVRREALTTLSKMRYDIAVDYLNQVMTERSDPMAPAAALALGTTITNQANDPVSKKAMEMLQRKLAKNDAEPSELIQAILTALAGSRAGTQWLLQQQEQKKLRPELVADAGRLLRNSPFQGERNKAMILFPPPGKLDPKKLPSPNELAKRTGSAERGKAVMAASLKGETQCMKCHLVNGAGGQIGPDLSAIGLKGSKEDLYNSILFPSKAIADQYVSWKVDTEDGQSVTGLLIQETETTITIRDANGKDYALPVKGSEKKKQLVSLMPEGLINTLTEEELTDLVDYLFTLRTEVKPK